MPVSTCPHCQARLWVNKSQLTVSHGFVFCSLCEGLFPARDHIVEHLPENIETGWLHESYTNVALVNRLSPVLRQYRELSKPEMVKLLKSLPPPALNAPSFGGGTPLMIEYDSETEQAREQARSAPRPAAAAAATAGPAAAPSPGAGKMDVEEITKLMESISPGKKYSVLEKEQEAAGRSKKRLNKTAAEPSGRKFNWTVAIVIAIVLLVVQIIFFLRA